MQRESTKGMQAAYDLLFEDSESTDILDHIHSGVAGMMVVHDEDLDSVARARKGKGSKPIECNGCDAVYVYPGGWKH